VFWAIIIGRREAQIAFPEAMQVSLLIRNGKEDSNNHRGRFDIIADILDASLGGVKKTHLMYHCNLSFRQLKIYSHFLLSQGFLRIIIGEDSNNNGTFEVTDKGREFLKAYRGLKSLMQ
jgi:predicted transcriptional regulator